MLLNIPFVRLINILTLLDFFIFFIIRKQFLPSETSLFNISQLRKPHFIDTYHVFTSSSVYFEIFAYYTKKNHMIVIPYCANFDDVELC